MSMGCKRARTQRLSRTVLRENISAAMHLLVHAQGSVILFYSVLLFLLISEEMNSLQKNLKSKEQTNKTPGYWEIP